MKKGRASEYTKRQDGATTVFDVTPASAPKFMYLVIFGGFIGLLGIGMIASGGIFMVLMAGFAIWYGWFRDQRPKDHKVSKSFRVTSDRIEANGSTFAKDDIHRLILKNGITDKELPVQQWTTNRNEMAGMAHRANASMVSNSLNVETGGKSTLLAGGMDETTAYGLLTDVSKVLGFSQS